jgi:phage baseplate assembly protein W
MANSLVYKGFTTQSSVITGSTLYDLEIAKADLMNHFMTRKGERVMAPTFGSEIWDYLFDPMNDDVIQMVRNDVVSIVKADPRFDLQSVNVTQYEHGITVTLDLYYYPMDILDTLAITFDQSALEAK